MAVRRGGRHGSPRLVNTLRGPIVVMEALDAGVTGAGLDVFEDEPRIHPGWSCCRTRSPFPTSARPASAPASACFDMSLENVAAVLAGGDPVTLVARA